MPFLRANIDRAIVMTQYDLRGFAHPLGIRTTMPVPKFLDAATCNFASFASGGSDNRTVDNFPNYFNSTYEDTLAMCKQLYADCECNSQKEAIRLIFEEIERQMGEIRQGEANGTREHKSAYTQELTKDTRWGRMVLAMKEVFGTPDDSQSVAA